MNTRILPAGDTAWLIELPERIDPAVNTRAIEIARAIEASDLPVSDLVVGYRSVMVFVDPLSDRASDIETRLQQIATDTPSES